MSPTDFVSMCVHAFLAGATLQRFLVARKFDVEEAFKMLMNYVHWRLSYPENAVKQEEIRASLDARKVYVGKHTDRAGHIYIVVRLFSLLFSSFSSGSLTSVSSFSSCLLLHSHPPPTIRKIVVRKHKKAIDIEETKKMILYTLDKVISTYLTGKKSMDKMTCIIDLQSISWENLDGEALKVILQFLQNYFPERLALMVLWQPPTIFWIVYKMVVPFVDEKTRSKIVMAYNTKDLTKSFNANRLPTSIGGSGTEESLFIPIETLTRKDIEY